MKKINPYSKLFLESKTKKNLIFLIVSAIFLWLLSFWLFFFKQEKSFKSSSQITFITLTNFSSSGVTVIWKTKEEVKSHIIYGKDIQSLSYKSEDIFSEDKPSQIHYSKIKNLDPKTTYYFLIWDGTKYIGKNFKTPYSFNTPERFSLAKIEPVVAKLNYKGKPLSNVVVILDIEGFSSFSAVTSEDGTFIIPLSLTFDSSLKVRKIPSGKESFSLKIMNPIEKIVAYGNLELLLSYTGTIDVENIYSFNFQGNKNKENKPLVVKNQNKGNLNKVYLSYPLENAVISELNPLIRGTGVPGKEVLVEIRGPLSVVSKAIVDDEGDWWIDLIDPLPPAEYKVLVNTVDENGDSVQIIRNFTITKSGESILGEATEEADVSITVTPTLTQVVETPTPTKLPVSTVTPIPTNNQIITTPTFIPTPTPSPPNSGFNLNIVIFASLIAFLISAVLTIVKFNI